MALPYSEGVQSLRGQLLVAAPSLLDPNFARAVVLLEGVARDVGARGIEHDERVAKVSIVGVGMRSHSGVASKMFAALAREGINIQMISTSEIAISCVIEDKYAELAVRALHDAFEVGGGIAR